MEWNKLAGIISGLHFFPRILDGTLREQNLPPPREQIVYFRSNVPGSGNECSLWNLVYFDHSIPFQLLTMPLLKTNTPFAVELQLLEHLWNHENLFETGVVRAQHQVRRHNSDVLSIFFKMKVYCVLSLESPHRGDSNAYTQYTIFNKENHPKLSQIRSYGIFPRGLKNLFETQPW